MKNVTKPALCFSSAPDAFSGVYLARSLWRGKSEDDRCAGRNSIFCRRIFLDAASNCLSSDKPRESIDDNASSRSLATELEPFSVMLQLKVMHISSVNTLVNISCRLGMLTGLDLPGSRKISRSREKLPERNITGKLRTIHHYKIPWQQFVSQRNGQRHFIHNSGRCLLIDVTSR